MKKLLLALVLLSSTAQAQFTRTWDFLTTGNGFGFQVFDINQKKITTFLEHPYRYLRQDVNPMSDGVGRRNLVYDFYFGVRGGGSSAWLNTATLGQNIEYVDQSHIIHVPTQSGAATPNGADTYFFAPYGYDGNAMIALMHAPGAQAGFSLFNFHMGSTNGNPDMPGADGESSMAGPSGSVIETGPGGGAMIYVPLNGVDHFDCANVYTAVTAGQDLGSNASCATTDVVPGFEKTLGADGWFGVAAIYVDDPSTAAAAATQMINFVNGQKPDALLAAAQMEFETWRKPPTNVPLCNDDETKLWRQSESVLRMGQVREPTTATRKNTGMMLASLPPGEWHTGWVRDGTYAIVALSRMGHYAEAKAALNFFMNAAPVGAFKSFVSNVDYRISVVRYYGSGQEQADYSGQPTPNVEIDGWGLVLWAARQYVEASGDTAWLSSQTSAGSSVYQTMLSGIAQALETNLETNGIAKADSSIWEVHDANKKHFAYTTMAAARGLCDFAVVANKAGATSDAMHYQQLAGKIRTGFYAAFPDTKGALAGSLEGLAANDYYDAAVAEAFTWNLIDPTGMTATATFSMLDNLRVQSGGFKRVGMGNSSYDSNEWILVDLRIANAYRRAGRQMDADGLTGPIIQKAAVNFYLLPELYNAVQADGQIGKYTGSIPMVGYGGGAYVLTMLDRAGTVEPNDCGDGMGATLPPFSCQGGSGPLPDGGGFPGGGGGPGGGDNGGGGTPSGAMVPYVSACICTFQGTSHGASIWPALLALLALVALSRRRR
jgi:MYXO-CTERM domain-containing protein